MSLFQIILIATSLTFDSFAISVSSGLSYCQNVDDFKTRFLYYLHHLKLPIIFAIIQGLMPLIGYVIGKVVSQFIGRIAPFIAILILIIIGIKMIITGVKSNNEKEKKVDINNTRLIILFGIITSIDALTVGIGLALLKKSIYTLSLIVFILTFCISSFGFFIGKKISKYLKFEMEILGGAILVILAIKILIEKFFY